MPMTEHFQPTVKDWPAVKAVWLDFVQGKRPDIKSLPDLAQQLAIPYGTLCKKTGRWKREEQGKLDEATALLQTQAEAFKPSKSGRPKAQTPQRQVGSAGKDARERVNASSSSSPSRPGFKDEYRLARDLGRDAMSVAMEALVEEIRNSTGAARVSAIKELFNRAGLANDLEKKDEAGPYEHEDGHVLRARLEELLGTLPNVASLLGLSVDTMGKPPTEPHHLSGDPQSRPITPLTSGIPLLAEGQLVPPEPIGVLPDLALADVPRETVLEPELGVTHEVGPGNEEAVLDRGNGAGGVGVGGGSPDLDNLPPAYPLKVMLQ